MRQSLATLNESAWSKPLQLATKIWDGWGIQLLVVSSFFCQVFLVLWGSRRRYCYDWKIRFLILASYLLASNIATIALGKLTVITIRYPEYPEYDVELKALLAPLLLMHLGNPDCISAYSVEDTKMGLRKGLKLLVYVVIVIWILIRCFDKSSLISWILYIPLLIAGFIEPLATILTLSWVYDDNISVDKLNEVENSMSLEKGKWPEGAPHFLHHVLMAYGRFDCLQPHRANWIYLSAFSENSWMSVDVLKPEDAFHVTEIELGLVYDAIYTQLPMVCTKMGLWSRAFSISCLVFALCGFSKIFRSAFLLDSYVTYTYAILIGSIIMELYQILTLPFSYTAVIALWKWSRNWGSGQGQRYESKFNKILELLHRDCKRQQLWSNSVGQINLVEYCLKDVSILKPVSFILKNVRPEAEKRMNKCWRSCFARGHARVDSYLKVTIIEKLRKLKQKRKIMPFEERGLWTLWDLGIETNNGTAKRNIFYLDRRLDKCIIIWHIATHILLLQSEDYDPDKSSTICCCCGPSPGPSSERKKLMMVSELLSKYMMYLLSDHPYLLSLTTGDVTIGYASSALANQIHVPTCSRTSEVKYKQPLLDAIKKSQTPMVNSQNQYETFITKNWNVLEDVKKLVTELKNLNDNHTVNWELISGVWIEMLCYAAHKSQVYQQVKMLRKGGELITHVWLLLLHKTDKFPYQDSGRKNLSSQP